MDLRGQLESVGMELTRDRENLQISLENLQDALERLLARARNDDLTLDQGERIRELLWVTTRARKEKGQTHLLLTNADAARPLLLVSEPDPIEDLADHLMEDDGPLDLALLDETADRWPVEGVDLTLLMERIVPLIGDVERGPICARLLGLMGDKSATGPLEEALLRAPNQTHRLAIIQALGCLGENDRCIRTLRSMLAHGSSHSHDATVKVLSSLARPEHCDILFGMAPLVETSHRCVIASMLYRFGDLRGYEMMESATGALDDSVESALLVRALEALGQTHSTRFIPMAEDLHTRLSSPWCKALAMRVKAS
ncbi:MAG: hypothetical protein VX938_09480, partial [Myxococcota bacterium]|nr:hypothetical protein [Myxococcota bacterium]